MELLTMFLLWCGKQWFSTSKHQVQRKFKFYISIGVKDLANEREL